jgi:hypothetical protein
VLKKKNNKGKKKGLLHRHLRFKPATKTADDAGDQYQ